MKPPTGFHSESLWRYQYLFYALLFASWVWSSLHSKAIGETVLYSVALAASVFLGVLQLRSFDMRTGRWGREREGRQGDNAMTLTLELPPEVEDALAAEARRKGTTPAGLVLEDLRHRYAISAMPAKLTPKVDPTLALFAQWDAEDATDDPKELAKRQREGDELMDALAANRLSFEGRTDVSDLLDDDDAPLAERA